MTLAQVAVEDTYSSVRKMVHSVIHKFRRKYGGEPDDLESIAGEAYTKAYRSFDHSRSGFTTHVWWSVWYALMNDRRERLQEGSRMPRADDYDLSDVERKEMQHTFGEWLSELSQDARTVALLAIHAPLEMRLAMREDVPGVRKRHALVRFLKGMGWDKMRIRDTFQEVRRALR